MPRQPSAEQNPQILSLQDDRDADRLRRKGAAATGKRHRRRVPQVRPAPVTSPQTTTELYGDGLAVTGTLNLWSRKGCQPREERLR